MYAGNCSSDHTLKIHIKTTKAQKKKKEKPFKQTETYDNRQK